MTGKDGLYVFQLSFAQLQHIWRVPAVSKSTGRQVFRHASNTEKQGMVRVCVHWPRLTRITRHSPQRAKDPSWANHSSARRSTTPTLHVHKALITIRKRHPVTEAVETRVLVAVALVTGLLQDCRAGSYICGGNNVMADGGPRRLQRKVVEAKSKVSLWPAVV